MVNDDHVFGAEGCVRINLCHFNVVTLETATQWRSVLKKMNKGYGGFVDRREEVTALNTT